MGISTRTIHVQVESQEEGELATWNSLQIDPSTPEDFSRWKTWAAGCVEAKRWPTRAPATAWRAVIAQWTGNTVEPQQSCSVANEFFSKAAYAPAYVVRAAQQLFDECIESGATSPDVLYLVAAFAWPLRDLLPESSDTAWQYLIHAPWQTEAASLIVLCKTANASKALQPDRALIDLACRRVEAGLNNAARELLEAVAMVQAECDSVDAIKAGALTRKPLLQDAKAAIVKLARTYIRDGETQIYARSVIDGARQIEAVKDDLDTAIESTVWDRPLDETYDWGKDKSPSEIDNEIKRALAANQPHHARRIALGVVVRKYDRRVTGSAVSNVSTAIKKFCTANPADLVKDPSARRAAEHLAVLYSRSNVGTEEARQFVRRVAEDIAFTGRGASLHTAKHELEEFFNANDPYNILRAEEERMARADRDLGDSERRLRDEVIDWFVRRYSRSGTSAVENVIKVVTLPIVDAAKLVGSLIPGVEAACAAAFRTIVERGSFLAGDLSGPRSEGDAIRGRDGVGIALLERARELNRVEQIVAVTVSVATSFLPPGVSLLGTGLDLSVTLIATFRAVARIAALFGIDINSPEGFRFVADSFALGCSSNDKEGIVAYLSRGRQRIITSFSLGGVAYGGIALANYLWTTPGAEPRLLAEEGIRHLARICGIGLSSGTMAKMVPIAGAVVAGTSTYAFMKSILDAAVHLAARHALLTRLPPES